MRICLRGGLNRCGHQLAALEARGSKPRHQLPYRRTISRLAPRRRQNHRAQSAGHHRHRNHPSVHRILAPNRSCNANIRSIVCCHV